MDNIFSRVYIRGNEVLFYSYLVVMAIIMVLTLIFVIKELKKK